MSSLTTLYESPDVVAESTELPIWETAIPVLEAQLESIGYRLWEPFAVGSSAVIFEVVDANLRAKRALKITRPRLERYERLFHLAERERWRLNELRHQNVVRLYYGSSLGVAALPGIPSLELPFFVMELIEPHVKLGAWAAAPERTADELGEIFREVAQALGYLHENRVAHLDVKPDNVLIANGHPVIVDLGYAKTIHPRYRQKTGVMVTGEYAHPDLWHLINRHDKSREGNAVIIDVPYHMIRPALDMYSLGMTMIRALRCVDLNQQNSYAGRYLRLIAVRLLDGRNDFAKETAEFLDLSVYSELRYESLREAIDDLERMTGRASAGSRIPELSPALAKVVVLPPPGTRVPFTERVEKTVEHQAMVRLRQVSQLGLLNLVYPGAGHSRWEHSLGTFAAICRMVVALTQDETSPLFRSVMRDVDLKAVMVAALLHDVGQYPLAHDLEDADVLFSHESLTRVILSDRTSLSRSETLKSLVRGLWAIKLDRVIAILSMPQDRDPDSFRNAILRRLINGPIDGDKLDYLRRDSAHAGVGYGSGIDVDRLLACLSVARLSDTKATVGITQKGKASADGVATARYQMFSSVYWHHTARSMKAMLHVLGGRALGSVRIRRDRVSTLSQSRWQAQALAREVLDPGANSSVDDRVVDSVARWTDINPLDERMIKWLARRAGDEGSAELADRLLARDVYTRLVSIVHTGESGDPGPSVPAGWTEKLGTWAGKEFRLREQGRRALQHLLFLALRNHDRGAYDELMGKEAKIRDVAVLIDVPWKKAEDAKLWVVPELSTGASGLHASDVWQSVAENLNRAASTPRLFAHPSVAALLARVPLDEIRGIATEVLELPPSGGN